MIKTLKLVAAIFDPCNPSNSPACQVTSSVFVPKKSPRKCVYQEDQYQRFLADYVIKNVSNVNENLCPSGYLFQQYDDRVVIFRLTNSHMLILEVTGCIQVDSKFHVKRFYKGYSVPLS